MYFKKAPVHRSFMKYNAVIYRKFTEFTLKPFTCIYKPINDEVKSKFSFALNTFICCKLLVLSFSQCNLLNCTYIAS